MQNPHCAARCRMNASCRDEQPSGGSAAAFDCGHLGAVSLTASIRHDRIADPSTSTVHARTLPAHNRYACRSAEALAEEVGQCHPHRNGADPAPPVDRDREVSILRSSLPQHLGDDAADQSGGRLRR